MLTTFFENEVKNKFDSQQQHLATKDDIEIVRKEIAENKSDLLKWLVALFLPFCIGMIVFLIKQFL
jgi:hypothetical protein